MIFMDVQNLSVVKRLHSRRKLLELAERVLEGEGIAKDVELSLLLCDDAFIQELNTRYRNKCAPTDVLSFEQETLPQSDRVLLGDIVISLETVQRFCAGDREAMRRELMLLFCHGLLHLLGYEHHTKTREKKMREKQALYLGMELEKVWHE